jgi:hypothetical protein
MSCKSCEFGVKLYFNSKHKLKQENFWKNLGGKCRARAPKSAPPIFDP